VAAPVRDRSGRAVAAINISGPTAALSRARLEQTVMPAVVATAARISQALGYSPSVDHRPPATEQRLPP
jgi:IclR family pca regulon transcriptional regulator